jgi:hypothetical protein
MIKYIIVLLAGFGIGYTYGYMQGDAGEDSAIDSALVKVHAKRAPSAAELERLDAARKRGVK